MRLKNLIIGSTALVSLCNFGFASDTDDIRTIPDGAILQLNRDFEIPANTWFPEIGRYWKAEFNFATSNPLICQLAVDSSSHTRVLSAPSSYKLVAPQVDIYDLREEFFFQLQLSEISKLVSTDAKITGFSCYVSISAFSDVPSTTIGSLRKALDVAGATLILPAPEVISPNP